MAHVPMAALPKSNDPAMSRPPCRRDHNRNPVIAIATKAPAIVSMMRRGKRPISPEMAAVLADIAGEDAREATIAAVIEGARGTRREGVLREILGKALAAGVAGMLVFSYSGDSISATEKIANKLDSLYIVSSHGDTHTHHQQPFNFL